MKETNMEHYRIEIEAAGYQFWINDGIIRPNCNGELCPAPCIKWLMSEYKPEPVLTEREKHFVEFAQEGWIARDKNGEICLYLAKPQKSIHGSYWDDESEPVIDPYIIANLFPFITWEDEEPWAVEELRKLKVTDEE